MAHVAYLANKFPSPVEPYVVEEIQELRRNGLAVVACSARKVSREEVQQLWDGGEVLSLQSLQWKALFHAVWLACHCAPRLRDLLCRVVCQGDETVSIRLRALIHTLLGIYYAALLRDRDVRHIHVHHGYFSSWIGMVAARLLGIGFSVTLHGSDLLLSGAYLDTKLKACQFCFTISEFNRQYIRHAYPSVNLHKVVVQRLGVSLTSHLDALPLPGKNPFLIFTAGRLHRVKDHAFLLRACREFLDRGNQFLCLIAGEGPERHALQEQIGRLGLQERVRLLGHVPHADLDRYFAMADLVVLTSRSEGIPLVLMEAMSQGKVVLAPAITGIPELVIDGQTGFLYRAGSLDDFVSKLEAILESVPTLEPVRREARRHVSEHFNREQNLRQFRKIFLSRVHLAPETHLHAHSVLQ
ncbi:MAG TPA: glycosyltransferase family 4 protein [Terriglobales bacterium]|nr:glycosyltransferase family 4 protein [Terriglobales bacterium]